MDIFIYPSSYVDDNVKIGNGTKIWHFSNILKCFYLYKGVELEMEDTKIFYENCGSIYFYNEKDFYPIDEKI